MRIVLLLLALLAVASCDGAGTKSREPAAPAEPESAPADSGAVVDTSGVTS